MALPNNADRVVVRGFWWDETTQAGVGGTITFDPVPLTGTTTPNVRDATSYGHIKTRQRIARPDATTGYYAAMLLSSNDPDLDAYGGRRVTFSGETPFIIEVPYNAPTITVDAPLAAALPELHVGDHVKAVWLVDAALITTPPPTPLTSYLSSEATLGAIADGVEAHDGANDAHPDIRAAITAAAGAVPEQARDALGAALVAGSNVTITPNDGADTITISATVPSSYSDEQAQDAFAALIAAGTHSGISFVYNDAGNAVSATVAAQTYSQVGATRLTVNGTYSSTYDLDTTPVAPADIGAVPTSRTITAGTGLTGGGDLTANRTLTVAYGTSGTTAAAGNDARLSDTRTPTDGTVTNAKVAIGAAVDLDKTADSATRLAMSAAEHTKLTGVAAGATANSPDATLLARANHTGTQAAATITGLAAVATTGAYSDLTGKPTIPAAYTDEQARDAIGAALVAGANTTITVNDAADTITIASSGGSTVSDATTTAKGIVQLAGDLGGTAAAPTVPGKTALTVNGTFQSTYDLDTTPVTPADIGAQPADSDLTTIAGLTATTNNFLQAKASAWASRTPAQVAADLAGTTSTTLAVGNDARLSDTRTPTDGTVTDAKVASGAAIAESKLSLASDAVAGTASRRTLGTGAQQAAAGNDARLSDARTPTDASVTDAKVSASAAIAESKLALASDAAAGTASRRTLGTGAQQAAAGNDTRITGAVQSTRLVSSGTGLTGGGDLTADRTLTVAYGTTAGTAAQGNDTRITGAVQTTRTIATTAPLTGGGDLSADRTLGITTGTTSGTVAAGDDSRFTTVTANTQTASYTLVLADAGKAVEMNVATANTLTIPPNSSVAFAVGTVVEVLQYGAGQTTITPGAGVTLRNASTLLTRAQYSTVSLRQRAVNEWVVAGDTA